MIKFWVNGVEVTPPAAVKAGDRIEWSILTDERHTWETVTGDGELSFSRVHDEFNVAVTYPGEIVDPASLVMTAEQAIQRRDQIAYRMVEPPGAEEGWRSIEDDHPGWDCPSTIQVRLKGEAPVTLDVEKDDCEGSPVFEFTYEDGSWATFYDFDEWRPAPVNMVVDIETGGLYPYQRQAMMDVMLRWSAPDAGMSSPFDIRRSDLRALGFDVQIDEAAFAMPPYSPIIPHIKLPDTLFDSPTCVSHTRRYVDGGTETHASNVHQLAAGLDELIDHHTKRLAALKASIEMGLPARDETVEKIERFLTTLNTLRRRLTS